MRFLHTMIRVSDPDATVRFFELLGLEERRRINNEAGRFTLIFLGAQGDQGGEVELTYNWDPEDYTGGRNFGHLAYQVDDIYETCARLMDSGVTINRPPRDGRMAFVRTPDEISIELLQKGSAKAPAEPLVIHAQHGRMVMAAWVEVVAVPALSDNYIWLLHDPDSGHTAVVDPGDGEAALAGAAERGWSIDQQLITHWHPDHTAGVERVKSATGAPVWAPEAGRGKFAGFDHGLGEGDRVAVGPWTAEVWDVPGHTLGHIAYILPEIGIAFVGDTLFAMGCGRLFEGTAEQMFRSLGRLAELPDQTLAYPAHEYTLSNGRFAAHAEPHNSAVAERLRQVEAARAEGRITLPTSIGQERATNPFLRASDPAHFASLRARKDSFR